MEFDIKLYLQLSLLMFFEFAIWGAWAPVLAARCLGPLKLSGKQTGWVYATLPLASMVTPLVAGWIADQYVDARYLLAGCHLVGAILLFIAAKQQKFWGLFAAMFAFSLCYAATLPLVNTVMFANLTEQCGFDSPLIFIWAPVAWALVGYLLTSIRNLRKGEGDGSDCLVLAGLAALVMFVVCLFQPATPPQAAGEGGIPMLQALGMLKDPSFAVFMLVTLVVAGMQQFYFLGSARFMQDIRISGKDVPAAMAFAQVIQAMATLLLLGRFYYEIPGPAGTLAVGTACWVLLFLVYARSKSPVLVVQAQALHGLAYVFFMIAGQMYTNDMADEAIRGSAQGLIFWVQAGLSLFLCTQLAGFVMDRCCVEGKFQWSKVFMVPLICTAIGTVVLFLGVNDPEPKKEEGNTPAVERGEVGGTVVGTIEELKTESPDAAEPKASETP